jgi:hypothetical protein
MTSRRLYAVEWVEGQTWVLPEYGEHRTPGRVSAVILQWKLRRRTRVDWVIKKDYTRAWERVDAQ